MNFMQQKTLLVQGITQKTGDAVTASTRALGIINASVDRQAYYLSYLDTFRLITVFFIMVIPLVVFLKVKKTTPKELAALEKAVEKTH
jgi:DHA2 family multidrug resistance protein